MEHTFESKINITFTDIKVTVYWHKYLIDALLRMNLNYTLHIVDSVYIFQLENITPHLAFELADTMHNLRTQKILHYEK